MPIIFNLSLEDVKPTEVDQIALDIRSAKLAIESKYGCKITMGRSTEKTAG